MRVSKIILAVGLIASQAALFAEGAGQWGNRNQRAQDPTGTVVVGVPGWPDGRLTVQLSRSQPVRNGWGRHELRQDDSRSTEEYVFSNWLWTDGHGVQHVFQGSHTARVDFARYTYTASISPFKATSENGEWALEVSDTRMQSSSMIAVPTPTVKLTRIESGTIYPKYVILSVLYSPPGANSKITYYNGASTIVGSTFQNIISRQFEIRTSLGMKQKTLDASAGWVQTSDQSNSISLTSFATNGTTINGALDKINHDNDEFILWLNPAIKYKIAQESKESGKVEWEYTIFTSDERQGMDIATVTVGELKNPDTMKEGNKQALARRIGETEDGLTSFDYGQILSVNPFWNGIAKLDHGLEGSRFQLVGNSTINFNNMWEFGSEIMIAESHSASSTYTVSLSKKTGFSAYGIGVSRENLETLTWTNTATQNSTLINSIKTRLELGSCGAGYTGPTAFWAYRDKVYGTVAFIPRS
jgi:hypothetical protein